ncbi:MAG TPA: hypothetical protein VFE24_03615 [Pirellulales bacterium]|nr:hypothetical protein [Pirellulales bacterium]
MFDLFSLATSDLKTAPRRPLGSLLKYPTGCVSARMRCQNNARRYFACRAKLCSARGKVENCHEVIFQQAVSPLPFIRRRGGRSIANWPLASQGSSPATSGEIKQHQQLKIGKPDGISHRPFSAAVRPRGPQTLLPGGNRPARIGARRLANVLLSAERPPRRPFGCKASARSATTILLHVR